MAKKDIAPRKRRGLHRRRRGPGHFGDFREQMDSLHREMDRLFEDISSGSWRDSLIPEGWGHDIVMPDIDESEDEKAYYVTVELPGMDEKDVEVSISDRRLTISGEKKEDKEEKGKDYYRRERVYGSLRRTVELPEDVDESKVEAAFDKGVLKIELPKTKEAKKKTRHIAVKGA